MARARGNFAYLLGGLLVLWVLSAFGVSLLQTIGFCVCLIVGVWSLGSKTTQWMGVGLVVAFVTLSVFHEATDLYSGPGETRQAESIESPPADPAGRATNPLELTTIALALAFFVLSGCIALKAVLAPGPVGLNRILGSICVYLLMGYCWAALYKLLWEADPAAFRGLSDAPQFAEFQYFSFVTLTTLGYGDIVPVSRAAHSFATLEAIMGQFYVAVLVAGLVGMHLVYKQREISPDTDRQEPGGQGP